MAILYFFVASWILPQLWWAIIATSVSSKRITPVWDYTYLGAALSIIPLFTGAWYHPPIMLVLFAAWWVINMDVWINVGTKGDPAIASTRCITRIKYINIISIVSIIVINTIVIYEKLLLCLSV